MKRILLLVVILLLVSPAVLAEKPDPTAPNRPLQVKEFNVDGNGWIAVHEQGTADVNVLNFPQKVVSPFARSCTNADDTCEIDFADLTELGEVHISQASGQAQNVGVTASPRFFNGGFASVEVLLPPTINTADTGNDRDVVFSQSMDLIPVSNLVTFHEPDSTLVYFYISGYVVESSVASVEATATREDEFRPEGTKSP